jgi:ABC-type transport system, involved in lipoprotein release, permease component
MSNKVSKGYEISLQDDADIHLTKQHWDTLLPFPLTIYTIQERFVPIFSWLGMMKMNERIILIIMMIIAIINMSTAILILILERTRMIGILKAMGMKPFSIQGIFIYWSIWIVGLGILLGTVFGLLLAWLQNTFQWIQLDEKVYFIKTVPISVHWQWVLFVNVSTLIICTIILIIPAILIRKISIIKAIQFR